MRLYHIFFLLLLCCTSITLGAQGAPRAFDLKKGQVFDILLLNYSPDVEAAKQRYFKEAFPIASKNGYQPGTGFAVKEMPTQGNYHPELLVTGTWPSLTAREQGVVALETELGDFHEQRREIWSSFNVTYYELQQDIALTIDPTKSYVATMFWSGEAKAYAKFSRKWNKMALQAGGKAMMSLTDGYSPFGYYHNPDFFAITEWEDEAAFNAFLAKDRALDHVGVKHLNQFRIQ
jgi:hypothetical protein